MRKLLVKVVLIRFVLVRFVNDSCVNKVSEVCANERVVLVMFAPLRNVLTSVVLQKVVLIKVVSFFFSLIVKLLYVNANVQRFF